jgi:pimeloyl-ACP methyl ester carboxylesterase
MLIMLNQVVVNKNLISYSSNENAGNFCLLFLHGWRSNKEIWGGIIKQTNNLANNQFNIYALDLPGFGQSQTPREPMTVGDYAEVVAKFIKKLELKNVIIVGHSFGGRIGIKLACNHPDLVSKLVLVDSAGFTADKKKLNIMGVGAKIVKPFFKPKFMQGLRNKIYKSIGSEDYVATPELQKTYINVISEDLSHDMKDVKCATLIINGENDLDTPVDFGKRMNALIPNSKFVILPKAGHFSFIDKPEDFLAELTRFILL